MLKKLIISGFGGQGVLSIGKNLAEAAMEAGYYVTWTPSYGPEMRANCSVAISDRPVGAPMVGHPTEVIAFNGPSVEKFGPIIVPGGAIFLQSDIISEPVEFEGVMPFYIPCTAVADELGNPKVANMVMLGAYVAETGFLDEDVVESMIHHVFTGNKAGLVPLNVEAFKRGCEIVRNEMHLAR